MCVHDVHLLPVVSRAQHIYLLTFIFDFFVHAFTSLSVTVTQLMSK